jgi:hypothetical protein
LTRASDDEADGDGDFGNEEADGLGVAPGESDAVTLGFVDPVGSVGVAVGTEVHAARLSARKAHDAV